jgi:hypothetical protein
MLRELLPFCTVYGYQFDMSLRRNYGIYGCYVLVPRLKEFEGFIRSLASLPPLDE